MPDTYEAGDKPFITQANAPTTMAQQLSGATTASRRQSRMSNSMVGSTPMVEQQQQLPEYGIVDL